MLRRHERRRCVVRRALPRQRRTVSLSPHPHRHHCARAPRPSAADPIHHCTCGTRRGNQRDTCMRATRGLRSWALALAAEAGVRGRRGGWRGRTTGCGAYAGTGGRDLTCVRENTKRDWQGRAGQLDLQSPDIRSVDVPGCPAHDDKSGSSKERYARVSGLLLGFWAREEGRRGRGDAVGGWARKRPIHTREQPWARMRQSPEDGRGIAGLRSVPAPRAPVLSFPSSAAVRLLVCVPLLIFRRVAAGDLDRREGRVSWPGLSAHAHARRTSVPLCGADVLPSGRRRPCMCAGMRSQLHQDSAYATQLSFERMQCNSYLDLHIMDHRPTSRGIGQCDCRRGLQAVILQMLTVRAVFELRA
ncbi:hypothetical protein DFH07DRAFT_572760 [Mycena maculata]|uniref:Uncharacterized protein n=1 Tax=Mycena maculata TaxID=230809 RepID=A0AAD7ITA5_9AGAR|nr:hypothetical protein DFH07DRAFT_572760 [Mycena maculata]